MTPIGTKIRQLRRKRNLTQVQLAARLGVSQAEISRIECNRTRVTIDEVREIASVLGVAVADLIENEPLREKVLDTAQVS